MSGCCQGPTVACFRSNPFVVRGPLSWPVSLLFSLQRQHLICHRRDAPPPALPCILSSCACLLFCTAALLRSQLGAGVRAGTGDAPAECTPAIVRKVAQQHLASPAVFCIMPLQVCSPSSLAAALVGAFFMVSLFSELLLCFVVWCRLVDLSSVAALPLLACAQHVALVTTKPSEPPPGVCRTGWRFPEPTTHVRQRRRRSTIPRMRGTTGGIACNRTSRICCRIRSWCC